MNKKKIVFVTGTRADFGKLKPLMEKVEKSKKIKSFIFVTGMHLLKKYGSTFNEVEKSGFKNIHKFSNQKSQTDSDIILGNTIKGLNEFCKKIKPDMIIVHGDRVETLAGAIVGSFNNILVSHVEGGEISGTIDELIRHAVTKLSHIHFVSNKEAKKRLIQLGENKNSIFIIGSPDIEIMLSKDLPSLNETKKRYQIDFKKYNVFIFHPITTEIKSLKNQIVEVTKALKKSNQNYVVIYPNNDLGSEIILNELNKLEKNHCFKIFPSIRFVYFLTLLKNAEFVIGNSSAIVRESEVYGIPAISIGTRQLKRSPNKDIINVQPEKNEILKAIDKALNLKIKSRSYFGGSIKSSNEFIKTLDNEKIWKTPLQKQFIDLKN